MADIIDIKDAHKRRRRNNGPRKAPRLSIAMRAMLVFGCAFIGLLIYVMIRGSGAPGPVATIIGIAATAWVTMMATHEEFRKNRE